MALNSKGYVLLEVMVGLISYAALLAIMVQMIVSMNQVEIPPSTITYELAIKQLQWQISVNNHLYVTENGYCFDYLTQERCLLIRNNHLMMSPGTQIIMVGLDNMMLYEKEGGLWVSGLHQEKLIEFFINILQ